jgi:hypothetical protein
MLILKHCYITLIILGVLNQFVSAQSQDCCRQHGNICDETQCCDGTPLPAECGEFRYIKLPHRASPERQAPEEKAPLAEPPQWLYVWDAPESGTPHFSSTFPPWYRNIHYPKDLPRSRVLVYDEYNRLIDDTDQRKSRSETVKIQQNALSISQQQQAYKHSQKQQRDKQKIQREIQEKQERLEKLIKEWAKTQGKVSNEMNELLEELARAGQVTIAMTKKQVQQVWGPPKSTVTTLVKGKYHTILLYNNGRQVILSDGRVTSLKGGK